MRYADRFLPQSGEFYGLVLAGTLGMVLMASANELLTAYISLELLSFSSYVLVAYAKTNFKSNEAGMKYIVLGAFSSALLLYGISLRLRHPGDDLLPPDRGQHRHPGLGVPGFGVGLCLIFAGLGFKIAAVPFHMWTPDVYEGAPTPVTAYLSVASKAAGFALHAALPGRRPVPHARPVRPALRPPGRADHDPGQPGGDPAEERQAPAGLLQHRPGGLRHRRHRRPSRRAWTSPSRRPEACSCTWPGTTSPTWPSSGASSPSRCCATGGRR